MSLPIKIQLPEHFLDEEVRCETVVTVKMKKIWAIEMDLTEEFKRVCSKYNLCWYAGFGTLLGAVRHNGFIPWDNDMDFIMPRKDFRKLCAIGEMEFKHPYYFKTPVTEQGRYFRPFAKIGNELTTGESEQDWLQGTKCGIFIDIFVLDELPDSKIEFKCAQKKWNFLSHLSRFLLPYNRKDKWLKRIKHIFWTLVWKLFFHSCKGDYLFEKWDQINGNMSKGINAAVIDVIYGIKPINKKCWTKPIIGDFENIQVPIPQGYDEILRSWYKEYMQYPPMEKRINHEYLDIEPEIPYTEFYRALEHS